MSMLGMRGYIAAKRVCHPPGKVHRLSLSTSIWSTELALRLGCALSVMKAARLAVYEATKTMQMKPQTIWYTAETLDKG
eukprot:6146242-Prymnesium_polylepis.1